MKSSFASILLSTLLLSISTCLAGTTQSLEYCNTFKSTKSVKSVSTATKAHTVTFERFQIVNYTPTTIVTPVATTSTTTVFTTVTSTSTLPTGTSTIDITSTVLETDTVTEPIQTSTSFSTFLTTTSTSSGTTTIAAPSGFLPAESSLPGSGGPLKRNAIRGATSARDIFQQGDGQCITFGKGSLKYYPTEVICSVLVEVFQIITQTHTARTTITSTAPTPISTTTTTSTITATSLVNPMSASLISTILTTSTSLTTLYPSTTITLSTTSTVTDLIPTATFYAACAANNLVYSDDGDADIFDIVLGGSVTFGGNGAGSAYDCCVSCQLDPTCAGGFFEAGCNTFNVLNGATCDAPNEYSFQAGFQAGGTDNVALFNGVCGEYTGTD